MNKIRILKIITALLILILLLFCFSQNSYALDVLKKPTNIFENKNDNSEASNTIGKILGTTLNFIQVIGTGIAILMLVVMGIKFVGSSPNKQAEMKKSIIYYVMGAIFIFAAVGLLQIIKMFSSENINKI